MPTVIDSLIVTLGLDAKGFTTGQQQILNSLKQTNAQVVNLGVTINNTVNATTTNTAAATKRLTTTTGRAAKELDAHGVQGAMFFKRIQNEASSLLTMLVGGGGLVASLFLTADRLSEVGRAAHDIGIEVPKLAAMKMMIEANGGSADAAAASFQNLAQQIARAKVFGPTNELHTFMRRIGGNVDDTPDVLYSKLNVWAQGKTPQEVYTQASFGGITDPGMIRQAMKPVDEFQKDLADALKRGTPTKEMTDNFAKLQKSFRETRQAAEHLADVMLDKLAPGLTAVLKAITAFIEEHPDAASALGIAGTVGTGAVVAGFLKRLLGGGAGAAAGAGGAGAAAGGAAKAGWLGTLLRAFPLLFVGGADGEDPEFSKKKNEEYRRNHPTTPTTAPQDTTGRAKIAYDYFRSQGYDATHAAALVGGIRGESDFLTNRPGDNGTSFGIGQWKMDRVQKILAGTGIDVRTGSYEDQLRAMAWELNNTEKAAGDKFRSTSTIIDASRSLSADYERSRDPYTDTMIRSGYALGYGREFAGNPLTTGLPPPATPASTSTSTSAVTVGTVNVHTMATDGAGIAASIGDSLRDYWSRTMMANTGIVP